LLLKRQFIRDTKTDEQSISSGTEYNFKTAEIISSQTVNVPQRNPEKDQLVDLRVSNIYNFLADCPLILTNLKPDQDGVIHIKDIDLKGYTFLQVIGFDEKSVTEEFIHLKKEDDDREIEKKDLRLLKSLDLDKSFSEIRNTELVLKSHEFEILDITSTNFKIIDNLDKLANYYTLLLPKLGENWNKFKFLLRLNEYSFEVQKKYISQFFSYEVNLFIFFKHPSIFSQFVLPVIKYKTEKRLIDYFLLGDRNSLVKYCTPKRICTLNIIEKVLLVYFFKNDIELADFSIKINNLIKAESEGRFINAQQYKILFNIMMNMKLKDDFNFEEENSKVTNDQPEINPTIPPNQPNLNNNFPLNSKY